MRIGGAGVCHSDLHLLYEFPPDLMPFDPPFTLGHENAGWVHALGAGVTGLEVGQPVAVFGAWGCGHCIRCRAGVENYCVNAAERRRVRRARPRRRHGAVPARAVGATRRAARRPRPGRRRPAHRRRRSRRTTRSAARCRSCVPGSTAVVDRRRRPRPHGACSCCARTSATGDRRRPAARRARAGDRGRRRPHGPRRARRRRRDPRRHRRLGADVVLDFVGADATLQLGAAVARPLGDVTHRRHRRRQPARRVLHRAVRGLGPDDVLGRRSPS